MVGFPVMLAILCFFLSGLDGCNCDVAEVQSHGDSMKYEPQQKEVHENNHVFGKIIELTCQQEHNYDGERPPMISCHSTTDERALNFLWEFSANPIALNRGQCKEGRYPKIRWGRMFKLSNMAMADAHAEDSPYFDGWKAYDLNPYDPLVNPSGIIQMGLAENQLGADLIEQWLEKYQDILSWKQDKKTRFKEIALHQDYHGMADFRKALAKFMVQVGGGRAKIDADGIVLTAGATAANEILTFCIANPGEALLVPTPYYPGFDRDLRWRTGVEVIPVDCTSHDNFQITVPALEKAYQLALKNNKTVKALLITNPSNPLGLTIAPQTLHHILEFAAEKSIHVISDEVYAGTVFSSPRFTSVLGIVQSSKKYNPSTVHVVYSLSKDLGLPGFRVGAIYSQNQDVITTSRRMSSFSLVCSQAQAFLTCLLNDHPFITRYLGTLRKRLRRRHGEFVRGLKDVGIDVLEGNAGLFCWVNLRKLLGRGEGCEGEMELWKLILEDIGLNVSPGCSFHCGEAGWFRVCFGNMSGEELDVALGRIRDFVPRFRSGTDAGNDTNDGVAAVDTCLARLLDAEQQTESRA